MNWYVIVFDRLPDGQYRAFHDEFVGHSRIKRWWHYIKSSYIVGTDLSADAVSDHFRTTAIKYTLPPRHLVMKVDLSVRQGWLPAEAWEWIRKNAIEQAD